MTKKLKQTACGAVALACILAAGAAFAQAKGAYTEAQAQRGGAAFEANCVQCHGADLHGGAGAPSLAGPEFAYSWKDKSAGELFDYVKANMPPGQTGNLSDQQYADVVARILKANGVPAGDAELPTDAGALKSVKIALP